MNNLKNTLTFIAVLLFSMSTFSQKNSFDKQWAKVDSLERKGLYRMALDEVNSIFDNAAKVDNHNQVIKSVFFELKYNSYLEEDDYVLGIARLNSLIDKAPSPSKEILHSLTAEVYWGYYSSNSWKFQNRTNVTEVDLQDIRTWDLRKIANHVRSHYLLSLVNSGISKSKNISDFQEIATYTTTVETGAMRPTLFDFLAHRALDFFKVTDFGLAGPAETFTLNDDRFIESNTSFLNAAKVATADSLNTDYYAIRLFYELTQFHTSKSNKNALFSVELERIKFIQMNGVFENKDDKYYSGLERLAQAYQSDDFAAEAWYEMASFHVQKAATYSAQGDTTYRWANRKAVEICDKTIKKYPESYGANMCAALKSGVEAKMLNLRLETAIPSDEESLFYLQYENVNKMYYKVVEFDYKKYNDGKYDYYKLVNELRENPGVLNKEIKLTDPRDYQMHSTEVLLPALKNGFYFLVVSSAQDFKESNQAFSYAPFWSSDITYQLRNDGESQSVLVSDRVTGKPIAGAKTVISYEKYSYIIRQYEYKTLGTFTTDVNGKFEFKGDKDYYNYKVEITHEKEVYAPNDRVYAYSYNQKSYDHRVTQIFTDRSIYRPGQTVYFKGIVVDYSGEKRTIAANETATVYFYDVNSQEIAHQTVKTNQFGSYQGEFTAPFGVLTGQMRIQDGHGTKYFRVEEYKRPKFSAEFEPVEGEFQLNDEVKVTGVAKAFAGNFIDGAEVKYRITRSTSYNNWWSWWYYYSYDQPKEVKNGTLTTDDNGEFVLEFKAVPDMSKDPKNLPLFTYTITADVTDINGETHSTTTSVIVGYQSLQLGNNLPSELNGQDPFTLHIKSNNLNGQKINAKGEFKISKLDAPDNPLYSRYWEQPDYPTLGLSEFKSHFPQRVYGQENNKENWPIEKVVFKQAFNTELKDSIPVSKLNNWAPGVYKYESTAKDKNGVEVKDQAYFTVYNSASKTIPTNDVLWVKELKTTAQPGEKVSVLLGTDEKDLTVVCDIEIKNKVVESRTFVLSEEQQKFELDVEEIHRGNFAVHFTAIRHNHKFSHDVVLQVPYKNKELDLEFSTFRNKLLPGEEEEWVMTIKNIKGEKESAELLATLYDASLDELYSPNSFYMSIYAYYYGNKVWGNANGMSAGYGSNIHSNWNPYVSYPSRYLPVLNYHGYNTYYYGRYNNYGYDYGADYYDDGLVYEESEVSMDMPATETLKASGNGRGPGFAESKDMKKTESRNSNAPISANQLALGGATSGDFGGEMEQQKYPEEKETGKRQDLSSVKARSNFNETAFFYPQLTTDADGIVKIKFTIPESLTKWRFAGLAHTKDLKIGTISEEVITQKELMVVPNTPRFLREGDNITLSCKVSNVSDKDLKGVIQLNLFDPFTDKLIEAKFNHKNDQQRFEIKAGKSTSVSWTIDVPYETSTVKYRFVAKAGDFSDGEENVLPILSNRMMVTESMPMPIRGKETKTFNFDKLIKSGNSNTLKHHRYTVEFTSNPSWYALQAMPYMMEYPHECAEQTFTRYYSNAIASHVMNSNPKIQKVIEDWGQNSPDAFLSNLQKNQELKAVILEETPWVLNAQSEEQSKRNLSILLDMNRMSKELDKALGKTINNQSANGGWPWFPGMKESRYITQHIITGLGHLDHLGIKSIKEDRKVQNMVKKGVQYLDGEIVEDYRLARKYDANYLTNQHIGYNQIQYLYARSYFPQIGMDKNTQEAVKYYKDQAIKFWLTFNIYGEGMLALAANRFEMKDLATDIVKSLKDRSIQHEEFGMYWKDYQIGYYWYQAPIETQALMIEMFDEVTNDQASVEELKIWLLKQKQTTHWKTTKQTTESVYALLLKGSDLLASDDLVEVMVGGQKINYVDEVDETNPYNVKTEAGTGYFKTAWSAEKVKPKMGEIKITKKDEGVAWGAAYWQYFEDLDKITFAETNLKLEKQLFLVDITDEGEKLKPVSENNVLKVGEKVRVRIELRTDRNLEYVHMKDMRASGFEPINVLSRYHYQDGLGYYQATKDAATNFFFDYIPKGTYVFEYDLRVQHKGNFSNGITTIQCMYAPEFTSHSNGIRVKVE